jgi:hypothetical protein
MRACSLQDIFVSGFDQFSRGRELHPRELNAARCISQCYTPALGSHLQFCPNGDFSRIQFHACRHRSCPKCGKSSRDAWIEAQLQRLLPCPHFHVIFTLPHSLLQLWEFNRRLFTNVLFDSARASLLTLLADRRHLGATPGLMLSLHTWGRDLSRHPHLHCLVTAGGIDSKGQWLSSKNGQLVAFAPLHLMFRSKLLSRLRQALDQQTLVLPRWISTQACKDFLRAQYAKHWNIRIEPQYAHGEGLTLYLARYAKGGPLPHNDALRMQGNLVQLRYTSHRDGRAKTLELHTPKFIERVLWHAPVPGSHTTRHAGLYSTPCRAQHAAARAALMAGPRSAGLRWPRPQRKSSPPPTPTSPPCPQCGRPLQRLLFQRPALRSAFARSGHSAFSKTHPAGPSKHPTAAAANHSATSPPPSNSATRM